MGLAACVATRLLSPRPAVVHTALNARARLLSSARAGRQTFVPCIGCHFAQYGTVIACRIPYWITCWQIPTTRAHRCTGAEGGPSAPRQKGRAAVNKPTIAILSLAAIALNA